MTDAENQLLSAERAPDGSAGAVMEGVGAWLSVTVGDVAGVCRSLAGTGFPRGKSMVL